MGDSTDWPRLGKRMVRHHLPMAIVTTALLFAGVWAVASPDLKYRWSMSTAYVGLALLGAVALIGPANAVRQRTLPISSDFRRDLAIWAALVSLGHLVVGWTMHMSSIWLYLFKAIDGPNAWRLRDDLFGWANYTGLAAGVLLLAALLTSNDLSIRLLGRRGWKLLQQTTYLPLPWSGSTESLTSGSRSVGWCTAWCWDPCSGSSFVARYWESWPVVRPAEREGNSDQQPLQRKSNRKYREAAREPIYVFPWAACRASWFERRVPPQSHARRPSPPP